jgi:hypothetical protein
MVFDIGETVTVRQHRPASPHAQTPSPVGA